ncbi:MAG: Lrp/AsnC family transcriptional regulator [Alphaproteobacteria bacterium]|nr:Lrp/AsnC family transcriptional regulator [Alphaproteobacteria bacterium]
MDEVDRKLLQILQEDTTLSIAQLAERVGLSQTPCWKRIQKLEAQQVITRRVALVDAERVGIGLTVFVALEAGEHTPQWLERFSTVITTMPEVMEVYRMAGDIDYLLRVAVADMAEYDSFYKRLIASVPMKNVTSRFGMERLKYTTAYPLHSKLFRDRRAAEEAAQE